MVSRMKAIPFSVIALFYSIFAAVAGDASTNAPVVAEVTIETEGNIARISVSLVNKSKDHQTLFTGRVGTSRSGGFQSVDLDKVAKDTHPFGNGAFVVPELTFGAIKFSAPTTVDWGVTFQNMLPTLIELRQEERVLYCVFSVPSLYVRSEFGSGRLQFPALSRAKVKVPSLEVPVTKCIRRD
jgi:hypothetical protein